MSGEPWKQSDADLVIGWSHGPKSMSAYMRMNGQQNLQAVQLASQDLDV